MENCVSQPKSFLARWRKRRLIKKQICSIGGDLVRDHGKKRFYSTKEVKTAWARRAYSPDYMCYAVAAYTSPSDFNDYHLQRGETCDYNEMRREVGDICGHGDRDFSVLDLVGTGAVLSASESSGWFSDLFSSSDSSSSDGGGDGGSND
jgi:hypothetical protein